MATGSVLFSETQRFRQWWIVGLLALIGGGALWAFVQQIILGKPFGNNPGSDWVVIVVTIFVLGLDAFMLSVSLKTEVRRDAILVRMAPIHLGWVRIPIASIQHFEAVTYKPFREYGGWGIRWSSHGKAYSVNGDRGVRLEYGEGTQLLIGSQRADDLARAIAVAKG